MKLIIVEGPDNSGKNTLLHNIIDDYNDVKIIHCHKPGSDVEDPFQAMKEIYWKYTEEVVHDSNENYIDVVAFNRFHISEYVYGQIYRNGNPDLIKEMISELDDYLIQNIGYENVFYIQLNCTYPKLLLNNEDGLSLSEGNIDKIRNELDKFNEIYEFSALNKIQICINDSEGNFRQRSEIVKEFKNFICSNI